MDEWTVEWWHWLFRAPGSTHPLNDVDGKYCNVAQDPASPVFFIAGKVSDGTATRTCSFPANKAILFGIQMGDLDNACLTTGLATTDKLRSDNQSYLDAIDKSSLMAKVDGCSVESRAYRQNPFSFSYTLPVGDNFYDSVGVKGCLGPVDPSFTAGYWVMLPPLPPGEHHLDFSSLVPAPFNFKLDVHYTLDLK